MAGCIMYTGIVCVLEAKLDLNVLDQASAEQTVHVADEILLVEMAMINIGSKIMGSHNFMTLYSTSLTCHYHIQGRSLLFLCFSNMHVEH